MKKLIILSLLFSGLFFPVSSVAKDLVTLQLRWDHQFQFAGYYAAKWQGYYDQANLEVTIKPAVTFSGILSAVEEVSSGRAHFGVGAADILVARDKGVPLVVVASIFQHSASAFYTKQHNTLDTPADFLKLRVARRINDLIDIELQAVLLAEGIHPKRVKPYPHQPGMQHLISGQVDVVPGYLISFPFEANDLGIQLNTYRPIKSGIDFYGDSLFCDNAYAQKNPDIVERFIKASLKGWAFAMQHPEIIAQRITKELPRTAKRDKLYAFNMFQSHGIKKLMSYPQVAIGHINPARWGKMHTDLKSIGLLDHPLDIDEFIFDPEKIVRIKSDRQKKISFIALAIIVTVFSLIFIWVTLLQRTVKNRTRELSDANTLLKQSQERFRQMIKRSPLPMIITDKHQDIDFFNDKFTEQFGYTIEDISTADQWWEKAYPDKTYRKIYRKIWTQAVEKAQKDHTDADVKVGTFTIKTGELRKCEFYMVPLDEVSLIIIKDITEQAKNEREKEKLEKQLHHAQKIEAVGALAGGIAHDFNNILYPIIGFSELSINSLPNDHPVRENLEDILKGAFRARDLVKQILSFSSQRELEQTHIKLKPVILEAITLLRATIPTDVDIQYELNDDAGFILANSTEIHEIVVNLSTNAYHAMETTGGILKICLDTQEPDPDLNLTPKPHFCITVSDTGIGIPEQIIDNIFAPYFTTKALGKGSGLGLSVIHGIVKNYSGAITVESKFGNGTVFKVFLPVSSSKTVSTKKASKPPAPVRGDQRILFIDDEQAIVKLGIRILERLGYTVTGKTSSIEALALFKSEPDNFDIVITDMAMPEMIGTDLARALIKTRPDLPIIICTGFSERLDEEIAQKIGIKAYIKKPILTDELSLAIQNVVNLTSGQKT